MKLCSVCSEYFESSEMKLYRSTDVFTDPTCNTCVRDSLGEDCNGLIPTANLFKTKMNLKNFEDSEKEAYYKMYRKIYASQNTRNYRRRIKEQKKVSQTCKKEISTIYKMCKNLNISRPNECYEVDHIVPIKGKNVCGLHLPCNLKIVTRSYNRAKYNNFTEPYYLHDNFGGKILDFNFEHLDNETHKELLKFIKAYNEEYTNKFKHIMISLMDKMIHDNLCVEDFEEICSGMGIDIVSEYNKLLDMVDEEDMDDYFENQ